MKPMSDNELDNFFKSSFEGFEKEPAAESWKKIEKQLGTQTGIKRFPVFWWAAASIVIILGLALRLYNPEGEKIRLSRLQGEVQEVTATVRENPQTVLAEEEHVVQDDFDIEKSRTLNEKRFLSMVAAFKTKNEKNEQTDATNSTGNDILSVNTTNAIISLPEQKQKRTETITEQDIKNNVHPIQVAEENNKQLYVRQQADDLEPSKKEKIKSVGDLVNFVVGKIDKRENKIVHFSKTEESEMEITSINLGLFKYRKEY